MSDKHEWTADEFIRRFKFSGSGVELTVSGFIALRGAFASALRAAADEARREENEACAKTVEGTQGQSIWNLEMTNDHLNNARLWTSVICRPISDAIRARLASARAPTVTQAEAQATIAELQKRLLEASEEARGAICQRESMRATMEADDKRLRDAGMRVRLYFGCDTAEAMADEIERLRAQLRAKEMAGVSLP